MSKVNKDNSSIQANMKQTVQNNLFIRETKNSSLSMFLYKHVFNINHVHKKNVALLKPLVPMSYVFYCKTSFSNKNIDSLRFLFITLFHYSNIDYFFILVDVMQILNNGLLLEDDLMIIQKK